MRLLAAALVLFASLPAVADDDGAFTVRDLRRFCIDRPVNCGFYVNGMIAGLLQGSTAFGAANNVLGCAPPSTRMGVVSNLIVGELKSSRNDDLLDEPDGTGIWLLMRRTFPCGEPS